MSTRETPSGEGLGFRDVTGTPFEGTSDPLSDEFGSPEPSPEPAQPTPAAEPEAPAEQQPAPQEPEPVQGEEAPAEEGSQPTDQSQQRLYAGRYKDIPELEAGYKNIQRLQTRTAERAAAAELRAQQLEAAVEQVRPYLQQLQAQQELRGVEPGEIDAADPRQVQALVDERVRQETARATQRIQQETVANQVSQAIDTFRAQHPDAAPGTPVDTRMAEVVMEFQRTPEGRMDLNEFPVTVENLGVAHQLAQDEQLFNMVLELDLRPTPENIQIAREAIEHPGLGEVLLAQPHLVDTDHGLNWARKQAQIPIAVGNAQAAAQPPSPEQQRRAAFVETGGSGSPQDGAPGQRPKGDEVDEAIRQYREQRDTSVFFGGTAL